MHLLPAVLSGRHGVRLSIALALHLCSADPSPSSPSIIAQDGGIEERRSGAVHLLLSYPREVVHFLVFGSFTSKPQLSGASKAFDGRASASTVKPLDPAVLLPSRIVFCAFLDLLIRDLISGHAQTNPTEVELLAIAEEQTFIDMVALHLLQVVGADPRGPYARLAGREAGQSSSTNACKVQAWQTLCLLCRGMSPGPAIAGEAAKCAWACLMQSVHHANIRPYIQLFLSRLFSLHPDSGIERFLLPALLDYGQDKYQVWCVWCE